MNKKKRHYGIVFIFLHECIEDFFATNNNFRAYETHFYFPI